MQRIFLVALICSAVCQAGTFEFPDLQAPQAAIDAVLRDGKPLRSEATTVTAVVFDILKAVDYLEYAYASYCNTSLLMDWNCPWCTKNGTKSFDLRTIAYNADLNVFGYVGVDKAAQEVIIAFRGTQLGSLKNWIADLTYSSFAPYPGNADAEVHKGFYYSYLTISHTVQGAIDEIQQDYPDYPVIVTGHSLGGALSVLCAAGLASSAPVRVRTFGSPRVGNKAFSDLYRQKGIDTWRMVNMRDIVPHLPTINMGFWHVPTEVWFNGTEYIICDGSGEDVACSDSLSFPTSVSDHLNYMGRYETC